MANKANKSQPKVSNRKISNTLRQLNNIVGQANLSIYGTDRTSDVDLLNAKFQGILKSEMNSLTNKDDGDVTSFLSQLYSNDKKNNAYSNALENQFMSLTNDEYGTMQSFIFEAYRNRLLEQSDLHEVASQLIELSEAILITRDAIISSEVVEGRMSRTLKFENAGDDDEANNVAIVENMEKRFGILNKIKNFIIPKTLEYGEYYMYVIPYSKIFNDFMQTKNSSGYGHRYYRESTLFESVTGTDDDLNNEKKKSNSQTVDNSFAESLYTEYVALDDTSDKSTEAHKLMEESGRIKTPDKKEFIKDIDNMMKHITICNDAVPIPVLEEGTSTMEEYMTEYVNESKDGKKDSKFVHESGDKKDLFEATIDSGCYTGADGKLKQKKKGKGEFDDISDCYVKLIEPTKVIPIKLMNDVIIGYYYIQAEDVTPLSGMISSTLYYSKFDENSKQQTIIDSIAEKIVDNFDKKFLKDNIKFKKTIVEAINYYNLNEKRLKFQYIPAEYMQVFKIDEDENGQGQSMIKKSLFYAKLYLMLLLFKIMSIILYSNDQKVNYIKQSGIDKDVANKVQDIARIRQSRQINMIDLFNYTTLINKVGNGNELYVPTGKSGERPIETEILSGQEIQLNSELLEMLKNAYILGTGVPAAIVNYMNEADFAKVIEQNNTKFNGRVVNYQLDFNDSITSLYKKIMRWSTSIDESAIESFQFILEPPKSVATNTKVELINNFNTLCDFVVGLMYNDPQQDMADTELPIKIKEFKKLYADAQLPMLHINEIKELVEEANLNAKDKKLSPDPSNGDDSDDSELDEELSQLKGSYQ